MVKQKVIVVTLLVSVIVFMLWIYNLYQYQSLEVYQCDERKEYIVPVQNGIPRDILELHVGGWIENGEVTITGLPSREHDPLKFSRSDSVTTVSHAYIGEWYEPEINILFDPSDGSSCYIKVVYRYQ